MPEQIRVPIEELTQGPPVPAMTQDTRDSLNPLKQPQSQSQPETVRVPVEELGAPPPSPHFFAGAGQHMVRRGEQELKYGDLRNELLGSQVRTSKTLADTGEERFKVYRQLGDKYKQYESEQDPARRAQLDKELTALESVYWGRPLYHDASGRRAGSGVLPRSQKVLDRMAALGIPLEVINGERPMNEEEYKLYGAAVNKDLNLNRTNTATLITSRIENLGDRKLRDEYTRRYNSAKSRLTELSMMRASLMASTTGDSPKLAETQKQIEAAEQEIANLGNAVGAKAGMKFATMSDIQRYAEEHNMDIDDALEAARADHYTVF